MINNNMSSLGLWIMFFLVYWSRLTLTHGPSAKYLSIVKHFCINDQIIELCFYRNPLENSKNDIIFHIVLQTKRVIILYTIIMRIFTLKYHIFFSLKSLLYFSWQSRYGSFSFFRSSTII